MAAEIEYEFTKGRNKLAFTLWICKGKEKIFVKVLGKKYDACLAKAKAIAGDHVLNDTTYKAYEEITEPEVETYDVSGPLNLNFGRYQGKDISAIDDKYLMWLADGALIRTSMSTLKRVDERQKQLCINEAYVRGLYTVHKGKTVTKRTKEFKEENERGYGFHKEHGDYVRLEVNLIKSGGVISKKHYYEDIFQDDMGNKYIYFGTKKLMTISTKTNRFVLHATIQHRTNKNVKKTYLTNVQIMDIIL